MKIAAVIMAGGTGERFWPQSRVGKPKQFLSLTHDGETMIQKTVKRLAPLVNTEDIYIVTNVRYFSLIHEQLPEIPGENIISEPSARNTAPCIGLAAEIIGRRSGADTTMIVLPSDHLIRFNAMFIDTLRKAAQAAQHEENLVTIGVTPTYPETGYGYINISTCETDFPGAYKAVGFHEKPDAERARQYVNSGEYLWNSGIFVWRVSSILSKIGKYLPDLYAGLEKIASAFGSDEYESVLLSEFPKLESVSIDVGVMEHTDDIYTIPGNFGWDDVGSWLSLQRFNPTDVHGNMVKGNVESIDTHDSIIIGGKRLIAAIGIEELIIVDTDDAILICGKSNAQDVKKMTEKLKLLDRQDLV